MAYMSEEGYKQLVEELKYLESVERQNCIGYRRGSRQRRLVGKCRV